MQGVGTIPEYEPFIAMDRMMRPSMVTYHRGRQWGEKVKCRMKCFNKTLWSDSSKSAPYFTVHSVKCNWSAQFWADHNDVLTIHYAVYLAEVGCKKSAAANVESVFSGEGKFTAEAPSTGAELLSQL